MTNTGLPSAVLGCRAVTKRFGVLTANDRIDFDVRGGEVHALVGENGAGKSTLMSILYGLLQPDEGTIQLDGQAVRFRGCADAIAAGIGMVFQHYLLVERFSVADNVLLGREQSRFGFLDRAAGAAEVQDIATRYQFQLDAHDVVETLGVGARQQVELLKVLERNPKIIILDEPTAALSPLETQGLFDVIKRLRNEGRAVIFITHKLKEVMAISDRVSVLRRGRIVGSMPRVDADETRIASLMIGSDAGELSSLAASSRSSPAIAASRPRAKALEVRDLGVLAGDGASGIAGLNLAADTGEIIGLAGVEGNGQLEFVEALYGIRPVAQGAIILDGVDATGWSSLRRREAGMRYIPLDRQREGLVLDFDSVENAVLGDQRRMRHAFAIDYAAAAQRADAVASEYRVRNYARSQPVGQYSGGTQQKFLIGRELDGNAHVIIACTPTRGVDIGAADIIYQRLRAMRAAGACILLVSYDLDEIRALSDRIVVFFRGRIVGEVPAEDADDTMLGRLMGGVASR